MYNIKHYSRTYTPLKLSTLRSNFETIS